jgi:DNA-binding SARP family transcriptional activator/tetratricopeptide (TPR) repeat protein
LTPASPTFETQPVEPPAVRVALLGELSLQIGDTSLPPLESARAESLLAYLLVHRAAAQSRTRIAGRLWPDSGEAQARTNLRHVLHTLRHALPEAERCLEVTPRTLRWSAPVDLDVAAFESALALGDAKAAVAIYAGDLLEASDDAWVRDERERLKGLYVTALEQLAAASDGPGAVAYAEQLVRADPLREESYRLLMRLHDERGEPARALRAYHVCAAALEQHLGVEPAAETQAAYEALLPGAPRATAGGGDAVLIGRSDERARLTTLWRGAEGGRARLVLVTGDPGVGKSRLVGELRSWCAQRGAATAEARSYEAEGALAYGPVVAWLRAEALAPRRVRLDPARLRELARLLPEIPGTPEPLPPDEQRRRLFDAMARALLAAGAPVLLIADDLHWTDEPTLQFLHYLLRSEPSARLLVVATARAEDSGRLAPLLSALRTLDAVEEIELAGLAPGETALLAERFRGRPLAAGEAERLYAETVATPVFVDQTRRAGPAPPRVQAVIEARLAQLSPTAHDLALLASAVGRAFGADVLARACGLAEDAFVAALDELWRRRIVRERPPDGYDFTHDRIREVAYRALAPARRRLAHRRIAEALASGSADAALVAAQFDRAGASEAAVTWYERAAGDALRVYADADAVRLLRRALELVRDPRRELALTTALIAPLAMLEGSASPALAQAQRRALELADEPAPPLLRSLAITRLATGDFADARRYGEQLRARAERDDDAVMRVESDYALGVAAFWSGELESARRHFETAVAGYRSEHRSTHLARYGLDPQAVCLSRLANTLWFLGRPADARATRDRALALAEEIGHPTTTGTVLVFAALLALDLGDIDDLRRHAAALAAWCERYESPAIADMAEAYGGYLDTVDCDPRGLDRVRRAEELARAALAPGNHAVVVHVLRAACEATGDVDAARAAARIDVDVHLWDAERSRNAPAESIASHDR